MIRSTPLRWSALLALQVILILATGCNDSKPYFTPEVEARDLAYGKTVYDVHGCSRCHSINGVGGNVGPDLTHVGKKHSSITKEGSNWLYTQINAPKSHDPSSRMPAYKGKMLDEDIGFLAEYLGSLK